MNSVLYLLFVLPSALSQFPGIGLDGRRLQQGNYGGQFPGSQGAYGGGSSYHVRGRLVCGLQGAQGARVSLWEKRGAGSPLVYEEAMADAAGSFYVKAEILNGGGWNGGFPNGYLTLTISHNCDGQRQMSVELPMSYMNQGLVAIKTFDLGTINLEARFSGEETNAFMGGSRRGGFGSRLGGGLGSRLGGGFGSGFGGGMGGLPIQV